MSLGSPWLGGLAHEPRLAVLLAVLLLAAVIDARTLRIPNWLTGGGAALGLLLSLGQPSAFPAGLGGAVCGLALGLGLMLPLYLLRVMGAGDVKLMAMAGAYLGVPDTLPAVLLVFATGGVLALATVAWRRAWGPLLHNLRGLLFVWHAAPGAVAPSPDGLAAIPSVGRLPYGVSICAGIWLYVLLVQTGLV